MSFLPALITLLRIGFLQQLQHRQHSMNKLPFLRVWMDSQKVKIRLSFYFNFSIRSPIVRNLSTESFTWMKTSDSWGFTKYSGSSPSWASSSTGYKTHGLFRDLMISCIVSECIAFHLHFIDIEESLIRR